MRAANGICELIGERAARQSLCLTPVIQRFEFLLLRYGSACLSRDGEVGS